MIVAPFSGENKYDSVLRRKIKAGSNFLMFSRVGFLMPYTTFLGGGVVKNTEYFTVFYKTYELTL